jgi:hypothetical protein
VEGITEELTAAELAARWARDGFSYQDHVAVSFLLRMLVDETLVKVACETQDDIVLTWKFGAGQVTEYVQVKSDQHDQLWSVALLCEQDVEKTSPTGKQKKAKKRRGTSIFEKNASRDHGKQNSRFRIVTRREANTDFAILKKAIEGRKAEEVTQLAQLIEEQLRGNSSLGSSDVKYWVQSATWDSRGSTHALLNANRLDLIGVVESKCSRTLPIAKIEMMSELLVSEASRMALGRGTFGYNTSGVERSEMIAWLQNSVASIPQQIDPDQMAELNHVERLSVSRCETLWISIGVEPSEAIALASQPSIGARQDFLSTITRGFNWIVGDFGAGKSLAVERLFQQLLADYCSGKVTQIPVFLRAPELEGNVGSAARVAGKRLGSIERHGMFLIVDALDEAGFRRARDLLYQAYEFSRSWDQVTILVTSVLLPVGDAFEEFRRALPPLLDEEVEIIASRFAGRRVYYWEAHHSLGSDAKLPLFAVLLGMRLRVVQQRPASRGELIEEVVQKAIKARSYSVETLMERLCQLAVASTDLEGGPVLARNLRWSPVELTALCQSRLVTEHDGTIQFPVSSIRLWFAAEALHNGAISPDSFAHNRPRVFAWWQAFEMFLAVGSFEGAARLLTNLAAEQPALAAKLVAGAFRNHQVRDVKSTMSATELGSQTQQSLRAWVEGVNVLSPLFATTDSSGKPLPIQAAIDGDKFYVAWVDDVGAPTSVAVPLQELVSGGKHVRFYTKRDQAAHVWDSSLDIVASELERVRRSMEANARNLDEFFLYEDTWNAAMAFVRKRAPWAEASLPWSEIHMHRSILEMAGHWLHLERFREEQPDCFRAPHPPADLPDADGSWISQRYSPKAAQAREESILLHSIQSYQRVVQKYFPKFAHDLAYSAWWPIKLVGAFEAVSGENEFRDWVVTYCLEPVSSEKDVAVRLMAESREEFSRDFDWDAFRSKIAILRPNTRARAWMNSTVAHLHNTHPATTLVFDWLKEDLLKAGWGSPRRASTWD